MDKRNIKKRINANIHLMLVMLLGLISLPVMANTLSVITLTQAEKIAIHQAPELKSLQAKSRSLNQSAIAAGQFSDPKLMLGAMNVPVNTFNFSQEPMTQVQVGLMQSFPKGRTLHYRLLKEKAASHAEYEKAQAMKSKIRRAVRISWFELYYWTHAKRIVLAQKKVFQHLFKVTESMLANNKAQQKDVIRSQLEITDLDNQVIEINQHVDTARANLARWIGDSMAARAYPNQLPKWKNPPTVTKLKNIIKAHPELQADQADILASQEGVKLAQQQYKPGFSLGVAYGFRQGHDTDGGKRADFLTAQLSIDLPFFTHNRQDRTLKASEENLIESQENQMSHYRQLVELLKTEYATWQQQRKSAWLYRKHLIPEANQYTESTLIAYQNTQTDFPTLARGYVRALNTTLLGLKASVNTEIARANLLYLEGK